MKGTSNMSDQYFQGININDIEYLNYIVENHLHDLTEICIETDLSAEFRLRQLEERGYILIENHDVRLTFKAIAALTDYQKYLVAQKNLEKRTTFRYWVPHIINFLLSLVAIIISIIALLQQ